MTSMKVTALDRVSTGPVQRASTVLMAFPHRLSDPHFWFVQVMLGAVTLFHVLTEAVFEPGGDVEAFHHIPVTLYIVPIAYASLRFGWEGGLCTGAWAVVLSIPNLLIWHPSRYMWVGDTAQLLVIVAVGTVLARRVEIESQLRRRAEAISQDLAMSEAKYRNLFENAGDTIILTGGSGRILDANPAAAALTGYTSQELVGLSITDLVGVQAVGQIEARRAGANAASAQQDPVRLSLRRKDESEVWVDAALTFPSATSGGSVMQAVLRDVTVQQRRERGLRSFVHQITRAQEEERKRIARDLHDETAQEVALLKREMDEVLQDSRVPPEVMARIERSRERTSGVLRGIRRFISNLRPPMLDDLGLVPALEALASEMAARSGIVVRFQVDGQPRRLSPEAELTLFRIVQEALRNVELHAGATDATLALAFSASGIAIAVTDSGRGFDPATVLREGSPANRIGILGMRERAGLLGAALDIQSAPGSGTQVTLTYQVDGGHPRQRS